MYTLYKTHPQKALPMKSILSRSVTTLGVGMILLVLVLLPVVAHAQITNPLKGTCDTINQCILTVVDSVLGLAGILALAAIVYGGFLYITAAGNQDRIEAGKHAVFYSIVGLVVIALSYAILTFVFASLGGRGGGVDFDPRGGGADLDRRR